MAGPASPLPGLRRSRTLPARYPPTGCWPAQMRADMTAGFLDYRDTKELAAAVRRGDAPPPSALRGAGHRREPVWARADLEHFVAPRLALSENHGSPGEDLAALV